MTFKIEQAEIDKFFSMLEPEYDGHYYVIMIADDMFHNISVSTTAGDIILGSYWGKPNAFSKIAMELFIERLTAAASGLTVLGGDLSEVEGMVVYHLEKLGYKKEVIRDRELRKDLDAGEITDYYAILLAFAASNDSRLNEWKI